MSNQKISAAESIQQVMALVQGVAKKGFNEQQRFNFRGVDAVVNAVAPALREVGGLIVPTVLKKHYDRGVTKSGTPTVEAFLTVAFDWHGTDGGSPIRSVVAAEAMDTSDKATAKAMSVALRIFLLQTLMLPTDEKDPDAEYHERQSVKKEVKVPDFFPELISASEDLAGLEKLWNDAVAGGFSAQVIELVTARKKELS